MNANSPKAVRTGAPDLILVSLCGSAPRSLPTRVVEFLDRISAIGEYHPRMVAAATFDDRSGNAVEYDVSVELKFRMLARYDEDRGPKFGDVHLPLPPKLRHLRLTKARVHLE